jgi:cell division protein FtsI (penicillin-binding protein 3)
MSRPGNRLLYLHLQGWRMMLVAGLLLIWLLVLAGRAVYLQGINTDFLQSKGEAVSARQLMVPANRGMVLDRHGVTLAISTPVEDLWARPALTQALDEGQIAELAKILNWPRARLVKKLKTPRRGEIAIERTLTAAQVARIATLGYPGLSLKREFRRKYPEGETAAHVVGFTNVDDRGQEGVELAYQDWLAGQPGRRHVLRDRRGNIVDEISPAQSARMGGNLALSLDLNVQYIAHRELAAAVSRFHAKGGGIVVLDAKTGEILALSNLPVFNPNNRRNYHPEQSRNRAVTDIYEPGSTMKPFTVAAALERGLVTPDTMLDLPRDYTVGHKRIRDTHYHPRLTVTEIVQKSSNIGAVKIAMKMPPADLWDTLHRAGFGEQPGSGFPGEVRGRLRAPETWKPIEQATMAYGHGVSVSLLQLARAYMAFANDGVVMPLTFLKREPEEQEGIQVFSPEIARSVRAMMETVTEEGGTAQLAQIPGYRVAGKTGTAHKLENGRYSPNRYIGSFIGMAPASDPRLIVAVMIDEPKSGSYYGGLVAAPVFSQVMANALRQLKVAPDLPGEQKTLITHRPNPGEDA